MFQSMSEIAEHYDVSAKAVGEALYVLGIRDPEHPDQKGFPHKQYITHGIALPIENKQGDIRYFHYNIESLKEEFEKVLAGREKTKLKQQQKHDSGHVLQEGVREIEHLLAPLLDKHDLPELEIISKKLSDLQSHLVATDINLALPLNEQAKTLFEQLRLWRKEEALKQEKPAYTILSNAVIHCLAYYQPRNDEELLGIKGIGKKKEALYGEDILQLIRG